MYMNNGPVFAPLHKHKPTPLPLSLTFLSDYFDPDIKIFFLYYKHKLIEKMTEEKIKKWGGGKQIKNQECVKGNTDLGNWERKQTI